MPRERLSRILNVRFADADYRRLERVADEAGVKLSVACRLLTLWALLPEPDPSLEEDAAADPVELLRQLAQERS